MAPKKRKNCSGTKGYNCGNSCISVKFICKKDGLSGKSVNIANNLKKLIDTAKNQTKSPSVLEKSPSGYNIKSKVGDNETKIIFTEYGDNKYSVDFTVNDSFDANSGDNATLGDKDKLKIATTILKQMKQGFNEMPDGTLFSAEAYYGDGKGKQREKLYQKFGFSKPDSVGQMYGLKENGKLRPITDDDYLDPNLFNEEEPDQEMVDLITSILFDDQEVSNEVEN